LSPQLLLYTAAVAIGVALPAFLWGLTSQRAPARDAAVRNLLSGPGRVSDMRQVILSRSATERVLQPFVHTLVQRVRSVTPAAMMEALERKINLAGRPAKWPLERVLAAKVVLGAAALAASVAYFVRAPSTLRFLLVLAATAIAYQLPDIRLHSKGLDRQKAIQRALPDVIDQMTICVEAGLGFESAMARAAQNGKGPLADELVRTLQEMQVGYTRSEALQGLGERCAGAPDLRHFVAAVVQAEGYGIPIADVLRVQSRELRVKRRQRAEEQALKIPVKIVFPLVLCLFPSLFIVILGPAALSIAEMFGSM
jgi:tight adherence protein C